MSKTKSSTKPELTSSRLNLSNCNRCQLYRYLRFYRLYPPIVGTVSPQLQKMGAVWN